MGKEAQFSRGTIRGRQPKRPTQPANQIQDNSGPVDNTTLWDVVKAPFQGALHGLTNTGIKTRQQLLQYQQRRQRGLPPLRYKTPPHVLNPFRRAASSWFKDICENKPLK